jgi:hypothetical protein
MMKSSQEETKATIDSVRSELEKTIKHRVEDVLASVDQQTQGIRKDRDSRIAEKQRDLETSLGKWTRSPYEVADTKRNLREMADTKRDIHVELDRRILKGRTDI